MQGHKVKTAALTAAMTAFIAGGLSSTQALATEGYFQPGYSAIQKSLAGSGSANPEDPMTLAFNPAGLASVGQEFEFDLSLFSPSRGYKASGTYFVAPGNVKSGWPDFVLPAVGYSEPIDAHSAWGIAIYGNGGMNTNYPGSTPNPNCGPYSGVFCAGKTGVNLSQIFISPGYAWKSGNWSFGVAPIFAIQMFDTKGLYAFTPYSISPTNMTNRGISYSYGGGVRLGVLFDVSPDVRLSLAGATPMWMSKFSKYKGLFAGGGAFDIPANITLGVAWDVAPDLTLMADYKHIFYSTVDSVGRSTTAPYPFGSNNGPGFSWDDVDAISVAAEWHATPDWTLRAGYAHNNNPIASGDVTINILAPGVVTDHIAVGATRNIGSHSKLDASLIYVPENSVTGHEVTPGGPTPGLIKLYMHQWDFTIGYRYDF